MGCGVDWRRSFITTDMNQYYDRFIRWQLNTLRAKGLVVKDKRYAIFSPMDGQPCADHDRASGEGVGPQEYTLIKMYALELPGPLAVFEGKQVVFLAATLRPETMYGQTNCWVLPEGDYVAVEGMEGEVYVMSMRAALNLSYQDRLPETGKPNVLLEIKGKDLIGVPLKVRRWPRRGLWRGLIRGRMDSKRWNSKRWTQMDGQTVMIKICAVAIQAPRAPTLFLSSSSPAGSQHDVGAHLHAAAPDHLDGQGHGRGDERSVRLAR